MPTATFKPGHYAIVSVEAMFPDGARDLTPLELAESRAMWWAGEVANVQNVTAYLEALADLDREGKAAGRSYAVDAPEAATPEAIRAWHDDQTWRGLNGIPRAVRYIGAAYDPEV